MEFRKNGQWLFGRLDIFKPHSYLMLDKLFMIMISFNHSEHIHHNKFKAWFLYVPDVMHTILG